MKPIKISCILVAATLLLAGCASSSRETAQSAPTPAPAKPEASKNLRKGMTADEIRAVWGAPVAVHPGKETGETVLVYHFDVMTTQQMVAATMTEVPSVDLVTGEAQRVMQPTLTPQNVTVTQTIVLQLIDGKLVSWARKLDEKRSFN